LRRAYDEVLARYDFVADADSAMVARHLPEPNAPVALILQARLRMLAEHRQFDCTHHPAMSLPCGMMDGLPVGMMLVAKASTEETIYRAAAAFESGVDWKVAQGGVRRTRASRPPQCGQDARGPEGSRLAVQQRLGDSLPFLLQGAVEAGSSGAAVPAAGLDKSPSTRCR